jgi:ubiquinone/menaquinone biosynthesis C-methylase UbiE
LTVRGRSIIIVIDFPFDIIMLQKLSAYYRAYSKQILWPIILPLRRVQLKQVLKKVTQISQSGLMLDIGTGYGYLPVEIARKFPGIKIIGIDIETALLEDGYRNATKCGVSERVPFFKARAENLPFPDDTFDIVLSTMSLHLWQNRQKGLSEMRHVLKPGGRVLILVGSYYLLHGVGHITDFYTGKSKKTITGDCAHANFKELRVDRIEEILQVTATK